MNLLAELYNNQQNITQNPTGTIRTPRQIAYDNWLNAQQQAQNTTKDEWGQAIGNSVNGLAKIISSAVIKNPYEKAGATRNLDNFDDRQDQLVRDWAMQRMKNRNDFVQQAKEQLGMATADEERDYEKEQNALNFAYQKAKDEWEQNFKKEGFEFDKDKFNKNYNLDIDKFNFDKDKFDKTLNLDKDKFNWDKDKFDKTFNYTQEKDEADKIAAQEEAARKQAEEEEKKKEEKVKKAQSLLDSFNSAGAIEPKDYLALRKLAATEPDKVYELLQDSGNYKESGLILGFLPWKTAGNKNKFKIGVNLDNKNTKGL